MHGPHDGLHHLGFAGNSVGCQRCDANGIFGWRVAFAHDTENGQPHSEHGGEGDQLAAFGLEEIQEISRFHGWPFGGRTGCTTVGALVTVMTGGGCESRVTSTVKAFFRDKLFRLPSGVPVTAK